MAGRRWAQGPGQDVPEEKQRPRPSERSQQGAAPAEAKGKRSKAAAPTPGGRQPITSRDSTSARPTAVGAGERRPKKAPPSPEAMERARALLNPPKAPWHPLPLAEAAIVIGMVAMLVSVALRNAVGASAGFTLIMAGTAEFSWREHRNGYRSHASILGAIIGLIVGVIFWRLVGVTRPVAIGITIVVFLMALGMLDRTYVPARNRERSAPDD